ncbi:hypothetical protein FN846DRAFT_902878 [Sphaerosporella brunnea]|uniref:Zn(2)-C6 fungal-type domain-containing protein n=1 Tax=Sphaerosporella brunnea TaxID=1250544 RepID=A0A5J5F8K1_9PEZI|nr:hypothetical protein FN846DRAFT_902878 [Sphaerosporella brunnea]
MDGDPRLQQPFRSTALSPPTPDTPSSGASPFVPPPPPQQQALPLHHQQPTPAIHSPQRHSPLQRDPATPAFSFTTPQPHLPPLNPHSSVPPSPAQFPATPGGPRSSLAQDHKRPRACESCRGLKVKCEPNDPAVPTGTCRRCARANRECIFTQPTRKRQKKSDSKVAELEKKIDALTASLEATREAARAAQLQSVDNDEDEDMDSGSERHTYAPTSHSQHSGKRRRSGGGGEGEVKGPGKTLTDIPDSMRGFLPQGARLAVPSNNGVVDERIFPLVEYVDVIDQQLLSLDMAKKLFDHYNENMAPHFPVVIFPLGTTVEELRKTKPTLFLAILASASGTSHPDLHKALQKETTRAFAERIMVNSEKSMEIVQALLIMGLWYYPPDRYEELKFYTLIHMAAIMALDLGLGKKTKRIPPQLPDMPANPLNLTGKSTSISASFDALSTKEKASKGSGLSEGPMPLSRPPYAVRMNHYPDPSTIEARRTLIACYWSCSHVAVSLRRPNMLRLTSFMKESLDILANSPEAAPSDKILCQWVELQIMAEDISQTFELDDPSAEVSVHDTRVQLATRGFARRLEEWNKKHERMGLSRSVRLHYWITILYAHEVALHLDHNSDDFRPPFTERIVREPMLRSHTMIPPYQLDSISASVCGAHALLDEFCKFSTQDLLCVPIFTFVRCAYACMILIRIWITAASPGSELGKVLKKEELRVDEYLNRSLTHLAHAAKGDRTRPSGKFTLILVMLRSWYIKRRVELEGPTVGGAGPPTGDTPMANADSPQKITSPSLASRITDVGPTTPTAQGAFASPKPQTPLQLLSNAAVGLQQGPKFQQKTPEGTRPQTLPDLEYNQPTLPQNTYPVPPGWFDAINIAGIVEFPAGETGLGLGGAGADAFADETFWALLENAGVGWPPGGNQGGDHWGGYQ